jgi:hypothetical protein
MKNEAAPPNFGWWAEYRHKPLERMLARYFGDKRAGRRNADKDFRKGLDRIKTAKEKQELIKALKTLEQDPLPPKRYKDANWEYW